MGSLRIELPMDVHTSLKAQALAEGKSLNKLVCDWLMAYPFEWELRPVYGPTVAATPPPPEERSFQERAQSPPATRPAEPTQWDRDRAEAKRRGVSVQGIRFEREQLARATDGPASEAPDGPPAARGGEAMTNHQPARPGPRWGGQVSGSTDGFSV